MRRLLTGFIAIFAIFFFIASLKPAHAEGWRDSPFGTEYDAADTGEVNAGAYVDRATRGNLNSIGCQLGPSIGRCTDDPEKLYNLYQKSVLGTTSRFIGFLYSTPPASTYAFVQDTAQTLGFIPRQAYAQGVGFTGLTALLPIWKAFRNMAYALLAVVMIVIGFMVMLRKKIDPKTVVTVQNALPRIVITLLLITFSYAIVGLLIDLMYLSILFFLAVLGSSGLKTMSITQLQADFTTGGFWTLFGHVFSIPGAVIADQLNPLDELFSGDIVGAIGEVLGLLGPSELLWVVLLVAFTFAFVRILFMLLNAYVSIIISVIVGPLQILADAIPGGNGFSSWLKNLFSNIIVFPVTAALLAIALVLNQNLTESFWVAPLLPRWGVTGDTIARVILGFGFTLVIPNVVNSLKEALKAQGVVQAGPAAMFAPVLTGAQTGLQLWYQASFIRNPAHRGAETKGRVAEMRDAAQGKTEHN